MKILLDNVAKRFNKQWIFQNLSYTFESNQSYAILGKNGSGKSTLLQCIIGATTFSKGNIVYSKANNNIAPALVFEYIGIAAPYLELIEEFTALEMIDFHQQFKPLQQGIDNQTLLETVGLTNAANKQIQNFSSGMKQRLKLALAFMSQANVLCLDEPTANLDNDGIAIYHNLLQHYTLNKTLIIASNDATEYTICNNLLHISDFQ